MDYVEREDIIERAEREREHTKTHTQQQQKIKSGEALHKLPDRVQTYYSRYIVEVPHCDCHLLLHVLYLLWYTIIKYILQVAGLLRCSDLDPIVDSRIDPRYHLIWIGLEFRDENPIRSHLI